MNRKRTNSPHKLNQSYLCRIGFIAAAVGALVVTGFVAAPAGAWADTNALTDNQVTASDVQQTLANASKTDGGLVSTPVASTQTATDAAVATTSSGTTVAVPKDPSDGISISAAGAPAITIGLPNADTANDASKLSNGTVAYSSDNGSASAVIPTDAGVQLLTTIANASAPTRYAYPLDLPLGAHIELVDGGGATVVDASGNILSVILPAWAKDANGQNVPTHYETDGTTLTQIVDHTSASHVSYPVTADPVYWWGFSFSLTSTQANLLAAYGGGAASAFGMAAAICGAASGGSCGLVLGIVAGIIGWHSAHLSACNSSGRGVTVNVPFYAPGFWWCNSR